MTQDVNAAKAADEQPSVPAYHPALEALYCLIGRRLLDGADPTELADRLSVTQAVIDEGWRVSQEQLSLDIALARGTPYRLLPLNELREQAPHCVRQLLQWRERLLLKEQMPVQTDPSAERA